MNGDFLAIRPVSVLNLKYTNLYSYAGTICSDGTINEYKDRKTAAEQKSSAKEKVVTGLRLSALFHSSYTYVLCRRFSSSAG